MNRIIQLVCLAFLLTVINLAAQERAVHRLVNPVERFGPEGTPFVDYPVIEQSSLILNPVSTFVENIRSILGGGRNIERRGNEIHLAFLEGTTGSFELFWAGSTDNGSNWTSTSHLGLADPSDDRYPALGVNSAGTAYVAYHEGFSPATALVVELTDPFGDVWATHGPLNGTVTASTTSDIMVEPAGKIATGWNQLPGAYVSISDGLTWPNMALVYNMTDAGPAVAIQGNYVLAMFTTATDANVVPTDTAILNHGGFQLFYGYVESTDGGATWGASQTPFGMSLGDFPLTTGDRNGTIGDVAAATGTWVTNFSSAVVSGGQVYYCFENGAVTLNDGTFPYGYWDGIMVASAGSKAMGAGGSWIHHGITPLISDASDILVEGEIWQAEIGVHVASGSLAMVAVDGAAYNGEQELVAFFSGDGAAWTETFRENVVMLGFPTGTSLYQSSSRSLFDNGAFYFVDVVLLGDNGGVVNNSLYQTQLQLGVVGIEGKPGIPGEVRLNQNYPNPFNPSTQIRFSLNQSGPADLTVFNALGQKVAELVNGTVPAGEHSVMFDGTGLASGVYFYRLTTDGFSQTRKMVFVR